MTKISDQTLIPIGLALAIFGGGAFWLSSVHQQVRFNTETIVKMDTKLDSLLQIKTDIEVIKVKVGAIEKPLLNTQLNVKRVNARMNKIAGPVRSSSFDVSSNCLIGPFSKMEYGQN